MELRIQIPDDKAPRVLAAFAAMFGYQDALNGTPPTQTEAQFAREKIKEYIRDVTRTYEERIAVQDAREAVAANAITF